MLRSLYLCKTIYRLWPDSKQIAYSTELINFSWNGKKIIFCLFSQVFHDFFFLIIFKIAVPDITSLTGFWEISSWQKPRKLENNHIFKELITVTYYMQPNGFQCSSSLKQQKKCQLLCFSTWAMIWKFRESILFYRNVNCSHNLKPILLPKISNQTIKPGPKCCYHRMFMLPQNPKNGLSPAFCFSCAVACTCRIWQRSNNCPVRRCWILTAVCQLKAVQKAWKYWFWWFSSSFWL